MTEAILDQFKQLLSQAYSAFVTDLHMRSGSPIRVRIGWRSEGRSDLLLIQVSFINVNELVSEENRKRLIKYKTTEGMFEVNENINVAPFDRGKSILNLPYITGQDSYLGELKYSLIGSTIS